MYPARGAHIHSNDCYGFNFGFSGGSGSDVERVKPSQSSEIIAIITINNTGTADHRPRVQYRDLTTIAVPSPIKDVHCYHYIPSCLNNVQQPAVGVDSSSECMKACLKTRKSLNRFFSFINSKQTVDGRTTALLTIGKSAIVERFEVKGQKGARELNFNPYFEINCVMQSPYGYPHHPEKFKPTGMETVQYFQLRSRGLKAEDKIEEFSSVDIVSGICLFSREYLGNFDASQYSSDNLPLLSDPRPTLYELESLVRLPNAIAGVISVLTAQLSVTVTLDIPKVQYYALFMDLYSKGLCSREYINSQLDLIDKRHNQLANSFKKAIREALNLCGVIDRKNIQIKISGRMAWIAPYIRNTINQGYNVPSTQSLLQKFMELDPYFRKYCEILPQPPQDLLSLCGISYSYEVVRPILCRAHEKEGDMYLQRQKVQGRQLLIQIDNKTEIRTYIEASRMLKEHQIKNPLSVGNPLLIGMFPTERIFTAQNTGRTNLYSRGIGNYLYDSSVEEVVGPSDVVEKVYGEEVVGRVVRLMKDEGMFDVPELIMM